jgi:predicted metal-dependent peptidase
MRWIADSTEKPDMLICFTDGCVTFPAKEPAFPVIWADVGGTNYPWGDVVRIKP